MKVERSIVVSGARTEPRVARHVTTSSGVFGLPPDMIDRAVMRLGLLGLLSAIAHPVIHYGIRAAIPQSVAAAAAVPAVFMYAMWVAVGSGLAVFALACSRKLEPHLMLDIGLIFEVLGAFLLGFMDACRIPPESLFHTGLANIGIWIVFCILVLPNTLGKTALAAASSALMGPVALVAASYANNQPPPAAYLFFVHSFPNLLIALFAVILSRFIYNLGADVSKAREMGSYKLVELLGKGGMGEVWRAEHRMLARPAAIKVIQPDVLGGGDSEGREVAKRRFEREAQATAMLSSPHTIDLYDFGVTADGAFYYVMELLHGIDLQTLVEKHGPIPAERTAHFLRQVCYSLEEAHRSGLVHRDIKPANIYACRYGVDFDFVKVLDFGVVKASEDFAGSTQLTQVGATTGTPGFMAPEMALGARDIDGRADIYAVGCVGYWLLTGKLVFEEKTPLATILAHAHNKPVPPSQRTELPVPPSLEKIIMSCLEKKPERRPAHAAEVFQLLSQCGVCNSWTQDRAEKWWRVNMPGQVEAERELKSRERSASSS